MSRIDGKSDRQAGPLTRVVFRAAKARAMGRVPEPLRIMAHSAAVMWSAGLFELGLARAKAVPPTLKGLAQIKVASLVGCHF